MGDYGNWFFGGNDNSLEVQMTTTERLERWKQECIKERRQRKNLEKENTELIEIIKKLVSKKMFYALTLRELRKLDKITEREIKEND